MLSCAPRTFWSVKYVVALGRGLGEGPGVPTNFNVPWCERHDLRVRTASERIIHILARDCPNSLFTGSLEPVATARGSDTESMISRTRLQYLVCAVNPHPRPFSQGEKGEKT